MDPETIKALMAEQLNAARRSAMKDYYDWSIQETDLIAYVTMRPRRRPEQSYLMRIAFDDFPQKAPSYVFVDTASHEITAEAWPPNVKHNDSLPGICTPGTREFHDKYHLNDAQYPWSPKRYSFLDTVQRIQEMIEKGCQ